MDDDRTAIEQLVASFDDACNRRDVTEYARLWAEDAIWEIGDPRPLRAEGRVAIVQTWTRLLDALQWLFRGSFLGVVVIEADHATGRWPCVETGAFKTGENYDNRAIYEDVYVRRDGVWLFQSRRYVYLWLSNERIGGAANMPDSRLVAAA